jgi:hypothetical protein
MVPIRKAADFGAQLGPWTPKQARKAGQLVALRAHVLDERLRHGKASAAFSDMDEDGDEIRLCGSQKGGLSHVP